MKVGIVAQRYGQTINGGAELHARYVAEHLARHVDVEVLTTCASDYVTWRNELAPGVEQVNGVGVRRFPVAHEREPLKFAEQSRRVFEHQHSIADELRWLDAEGPASRDLVRHIAAAKDDFDFLFFFSYRYYQSYHGVRAAPSKAILVPTAERDSAIGLSIFAPIFRGVRALMYNSPEERAMIQAVSGNADVPSVVVGIGSDVPANPQPARFRGKFGVTGPFAVYVGRIDQNKGCTELFDYFESYVRDADGRLSLLLIGNSVIPIPEHPRIRHLGFLSDADKFDAISASEVLIMPSYFESLSMVALEAWGLGRPVLANANCDVLKGQSIRSHAGLYYRDGVEFVETLRAIERNRWLGGSLGRNGRQFFRENYDWPVIEAKYLDMLERLSRGAAGKPFEPLPGWLARRRQTCRAGQDVVAAVPAGAERSVERSETPRLVRPAPPPPPASAPAAVSQPAPRDRERPRPHHRGRPRPSGRPRGAR